MKAEDPTIATLLKPLGYVTAQFGKNHLGDRDEMLPTAHGFDEFFGNDRITEVDAPGLTSPILSRFRWKNLPRPVIPLDDDVSWSPANLRR
jgi:arylsulfatase